MFTECVSLVVDNKYVQFQIIWSLFYSIIVDTFDVDPHSIQYEKRLAYGETHQYVLWPKYKLNHDECVSFKYLLLWHEVIEMWFLQGVLCYISFQHQL